MRKLILMAIAGYLWKKFSESKTATNKAGAAPTSPSDSAPLR